MAVEKYGSSKTDVIVKLVLVFFMSLLSFTIGTYVGKKFSDNQHKLAQMEPQGDAQEEKVEGEAREIASVSAESGEVKPKDALNDEEIKKLAEEFVNDDKKGGEKVAEGKTEGKSEAKSESKGEEHEAKAEHSKAPAAHEESHNQAHSEVTAEKPEHKVESQKKTEVLKKVPDEVPNHASAPAVTAFAKQVAENKAGQAEATSTKSETTRVPQSLPKELSTDSVGKYTVQVASYPSELEAEKMASDLKGKGFSAFYVSAKIKDKVWYRVSVGIFTTQQDAEKYKADLVARAKVSSAIVAKIMK